MKRCYILFLFLACLNNVSAQTTVFTDPFTTSTGTTYSTAAGAIGTSTTWSLSRSGADWGARIDGGILDLTNDAGAAGNVNGWVFGYTPTASFSSPYNTTLASNTGMVTWTFNMRQIRANAAGFSAGSYGVAFILAGSSTTANNTGNGYAVVLGNTGATDPIRLVKYTGGLVSLGTTAPPSANDIIVSNTVGLTNITTNYMSVKVTYTPSTNTWELFLRDDGTTAFADPASGTLTSQGTAVDNTYTGSVLGFLGGYWQGSTGATQTAFFDNVKVTEVASGTPLINVAPVSLSGFLSTSGVPSAEQSYTVDGSNLTADISIIPPAGFEISTGSGGSFVPTNPITLTQSGGTVPSTPIYVRLNSTTLGANAGNITHTSTGSNNPSVALSGKVLDIEPTIQSTITIGAVTNSTVVVNFGGGNGARRILLARLATPVNSDPVDGTTYTANANFGSGSQIGVGNYVVYNGTGNTQLVTGLTAGATYHFSIYEYNDGGVAGAENYLVPGGTGNATLLSTSLAYVWIGLNGDWTNPLNWAPTRLFPATNDSLLFISPTTDTIINVPTQTVGYIGVSLGANATLQAGSSGNVLTIGNLVGTDLSVSSGSSLNIASANALSLNIVTGATAAINGNMRFTAGAHKLIGTDASSVVFNNGSVFTAGTGFSSNPFGTTGTANSVIFMSGSRFDQIAGSNPFALPQPNSIVVFNSGSLFRMLSGLTPSVSGRVYANFEYDAPATSVTATGAALLTMDNLTVTNGSITFGLTTAGINLKGNVSVAAGATLGFSPATSGTLNLVGTSSQSFTNNGTLNFGLHQAVNVNNSNGIVLNSTVKLDSLLTFTSGIVLVNSPQVLILDTAGFVTGASNSSFVDGQIRKIGNPITFTFPVGKTGTGYVPIGVSNFTGVLAPTTDAFTAQYIRSSAAALGPITDPFTNHVSACDYWILDRTNGVQTVDITAYWNANNPCSASPYVTDLSKLELVHFDGANWNSSSWGFAPFPAGSTTAGNITWPAVTIFSPFALGSNNNTNPLPITINFLNGYKQGNNHLLNWRVTCTSSPRVTMEIERSANGRDFSSIYSVTADALRCAQPFDYTDAQPLKGINYYRLKTTDVSGRVLYSTIVPLINAASGMEVMNIAPNPVTGNSFKLGIASAQKAQATLVITDMQGRVLQQQTLSLTAGFINPEINVSRLPRGMYQAHVITETEKSAVVRFVRQ